MKARKYGATYIDTSTAEKRTVPFDQPIKLAILFVHFIGFSAWYGQTITGVAVHAAFPAITVLSGLLLVVRELYKHGLVWLLTTEGVFTLVKVTLLGAGISLGSDGAILLSIVMLCGFLGSRLPEKNYFENGPPWSRTRAGPSR